MLNSRRSPHKADDAFSWDDHWEERPINEAYLAGSFWDGYWPLFRRYLPRNEPILEAGCGLGKYLIPLSRDDYNITGVDLTVGSLVRVRDYDSRSKVCAADILRLPFPDGTFGAYISLGVFEHFEEGMEAPLAEALRVVRPGGRLLISVPYANLFRRWRQYRHPLSSEGAFYQYIFSRREITECLMKSRLKILEIRGCNRCGEFARTMKSFRRSGQPATRNTARPPQAATRDIIPAKSIKTSTRYAAGMAEKILPYWLSSIMIMAVCQKPEEGR